MLAELIDPAILGFILVGVMLFAIFVGFPISFTLIFLGFVQSLPSKTVRSSNKKLVFQNQDNQRQILKILM